MAVMNRTPGTLIVMSERVMFILGIQYGRCDLFFLGGHDAHGVRDGK